MPSQFKSPEARIAGLRELTRMLELAARTFESDALLEEVALMPGVFREAMVGAMRFAAQLGGEALDELEAELRG